MSRVTKIALDPRVGEERAVAFDSAGRPVSAFLARDTDANRAFLGRTLGARVTAVDRSSREAFLMLETGEEAFLRLARTIPDEGAALMVTVRSEARRDKLARVAIAAEGQPHAAPLSSWMDMIGAGNDTEMETDRDAVAAAFDEILSDTVTVPGGGRIRVSRTPALTAIDLDRAGGLAGKDKSRAAAELNREGVKAAARTLALRGIGGLVVVDCIAPLEKDAGLDRVFARNCLSPGEVDAIAPSRLGLLQAAIPWRLCPLADRLCDEDGHFSVETRAREAIEALRRAAEADRGTRLVLSAPQAEHDWLSRKSFDWLGQMTARFGARLSLDVAPSNAVKVAST